MPKLLDFNSYRRPELVLVMKDEKGTVLHVTTPTHRLCEEFSANLGELQKALSGQDETATRLVYELAAKLINCNLDGVTITGKELATKYGLNLEDMAIFWTTYGEFIEEIKQEKN